MAEEHHRQHSRRSSRVPSVSSHRGENLFSDENVIEPFSNANGFQTTLDLQNTSSFLRPKPQISLGLEDTTIPPLEVKTSPSPLQIPSQRLNNRNSFSLRHDAQYSNDPRRIPSISSIRDQNERIEVARSSTILSRESTYVRPQSTYDGPSAPSHPYGMYPQITTEISRQASAASSYRPVRERSFHGGERPRHAYNMYSQDTTSGDIFDPLNASADIASVGFPGMRQQYRRRMGPEGEEADDIIGPDGHTEQLPPYTKYAVAAPIPAKAQAHEDVVSPASATQETFQIPNSATSMSDRLLSPITYDSFPEVVTDSNQIIPPTKQNWTEKSKRRTCFGRLPLWGVVLIIVAIILVSAGLGGVIGRLLAKRGSSPGYGKSNGTLSSHGSSTASTPTASQTFTPAFGAIPMSSPYTGPSDAPTGNFSLFVNSPSGSSNSCLGSKQQMAWACTGGPTTLGISVQNPMTSAATVELAAPPSAPNFLLYGDQHPAIQGKVSASYNLDPGARDSGAALYFHATYEKQVLLPFSDISTSPSKRFIKRSHILPRATHKIPDQALLWDCRWPNTDMDGYIYVNEPIHGDAGNPAPSDTASPIPTSPARDNTANAATSQTPPNLYTRKVKLVEYRYQATISPSCTLRQFCKGKLVAPLAPPNGPNEIFLHESVPPHKKRAEIPQQGPDVSNYETRAAVMGDFCYCSWLIV